MPSFSLITSFDLLAKFTATHRLHRISMICLVYGVYKSLALITPSFDLLAKFTATQGYIEFQ
jgi:hypothetical protein